jgi:uncharacterized protein (DUF4213/DUF364 family)
MGEIDTKFWSTVILNILVENPRLLDIEVRDYFIGVRYSLVETVDGMVGIAYSYAQEEKCKPSRTSFHVIRDFIPLLSSDCILERSLAQAAINSIGQRKLRQECAKLETKPVHQSLSPENHGTVVFIGAVKKIPDVYRSMGWKVYILDRLQENRQILPDYYAYKLLPRADVVYITGAAFSRPDIDLILDISSNAKSIIEIGPSLSIPPTYLAGTGLTHLETSIIAYPENITRPIKLGMGYHSLRDQLIHVTCKVP